MSTGFTSGRQEGLFDRIADRLNGLGYTGELFQKHYEYVDWFDPATPRRFVPAAAFARTPHSYNTACFGIFPRNGEVAAAEVSRLRALGAPYALEIHEDKIVQWAVGRDSTTTKPIRWFEDDQIDQAFIKHAGEWTGNQVLDDKNFAIKAGPRQLDFIDLGLIPALERHVRVKLDAYLRATIRDAYDVYLAAKGKRPNPTRLFRTAFWFVAAKVLHDRGIPEFSGLGPSNSQAILKAVEDYYHDRHPIIRHVPTQEAIATGLWNRVSFANLSVEILSYIYENTFVDKKTRDSLGIHGTPYNLARYATYNLPIADIPADSRFIVEPCCGHSIFLVAALQRLREILPADMPPEDRHSYFVRMLSGFDVDPFALEVARLCLRVADYPNRAKWELYEENVYNSSIFDEHIRRARVVLCNPPFRDFDPEDLRANGTIKHIQKPVELVHRIIENLPNDGILGLILPRPLLDGASYKSIRRTLVERYDDIEVVALPDKVFHESDVESALLLCKHPSGGLTGSSFSFININEKYRSKFINQFEHPPAESEFMSPEMAERSFKVIAFKEIWDRIARLPSLETVADIHRGIEWQPPFDERRYISSKWQPGFARGVRLARNLKSFEVPPTEYLSVKQDDRRGGAYDLPWEKPKVLMGSRRVSRFSWCIAAFPDDSGLIASQNYHTIWPRGEWTIKSLAAVMNGPVASAYVAVRENKRDIHKRTIKSIPLPRLSGNDIKSLESLVDDYISSCDSLPLLPTSKRDSRSILLEIDALILQGYGLSPRLERTLLDYFRGYRRPVSHDFGDYYPAKMKSFVPLHVYISSKYKESTAANFLAKMPKIDDPAIIGVLTDME
jgi:hypothetical protein